MDDFVEDWQILIAEWVDDPDTIERWRSMDPGEVIDEIRAERPEIAESLWPDGFGCEDGGW